MSLGLWVYFLRHELGVEDRLTTLRVDVVCRKGGHWLLDLFQHRRFALCSVYQRVHHLI